MNSSKGPLSGSRKGVRTFSSDRTAGMLKHIREEGSGKSRRVESVSVRVAGFRDPSSGAWIQRNPRNSNYYRKQDGRHRTPLRPTASLMRQTDRIALEVEVDRGRGNVRVHYISTEGLGDNWLANLDDFVEGFVVDVIEGDYE